MSLRRAARAAAVLITATMTAAGVTGCDKPGASLPDAARDMAIPLQVAKDYAHKRGEVLTGPSPTMGSFGPGAKADVIMCAKINDKPKPITYYVMYENEKWTVVDRQESIPWDEQATKDYGCG